MANFLRRFVVNFANLTKGFMSLLKKDITFCWDEWAQDSFDAFKQALASTSVIITPNYSHDFLLYVATSTETIGMVLVWEDEELQEHVIYDLSQNLIDAEVYYSLVDKLSLATVHAVQRLRHYILLP